LKGKTSVLTIKRIIKELRNVMMRSHQEEGKSMDKEFSAGAVIFRKEKKKTLFLFIYSGKSKIWGFPKGHLEAGESEKEAAIREIKEETGIVALRFINGFREEHIYLKISDRRPHQRDTIEKHSVYFLCETTTKDIIIDQQEILDYQWQSLAKGQNLLAFDTLKCLLKKAEVFVRGAIPKVVKYKQT
jgi:bis(5'-nucleosidyl)-tetraphosphatase